MVQEQSSQAGDLKLVWASDAPTFKSRQPPENFKRILCRRAAKTKKAVSSVLPRNCHWQPSAHVSLAHMQQQHTWGDKQIGSEN